MKTSEFLTQLHDEKSPIVRARNLISNAGLLFPEQFITEAQELMRELEGGDHEAQAMLDQLQKMVSGRQAQPAAG